MRIYVDLDDTVKDTQKYARLMWRSQKGTEYPEGRSIYNEILYGDTDFMKGILVDYESIPFKEGALDGIRLLKYSGYDVVLHSAYSYFGEAVAKRWLADKLDCDLVLRMNTDEDLPVDMSGSLFVDDRSDVLIKSNADKKYEMFDPWYFDIRAERDDRTEIVGNWSDLCDRLIGVKLGGDSLEVLGGAVRKGVQGYSTACRE